MTTNATDPIITNVLIFQTDNRSDVDYLGLTKRVNSDSVKYFNESEHIQKQQYQYEYLFYLMEDKHYKEKGIHPATGKINVVNKILHERKEHILVFLDSDAWIQNRDYLHNMIVKLVESENKQGCFSRDPYLSRNDYINSGSFILKINDYTRNMYKEITQMLESDTSHHNSWSYDQYYISKTIHTHRNDFFIFNPPIINTPEGQIIRHHWYKTHSMFSDLYDLLDIYKPYVAPKEPFDYDAHLDDKEFPNLNTYDYEYKR